MKILHFFMIGVLSNMITLTDAFADNEFLEKITKPFLITRHGKTPYNNDGKVMGQKDIELNEEGIKQAQELADKCVNKNISRIIYSPLKRAKQTAEIIERKIGKNLSIIEDPSLKECNWGIMEGEKKGSTKYQEIPFQPEEWWQEGIVPDEAESFKDYSIRVCKGIAHCMENAPEGGLTLFVAHGGTIMSILNEIEQPSWEIENCALYYFTPPSKNNKKWQVQIIK